MHMRQSRRPVIAETGTDWVSFANELTDLCARHRIGVEGGVAYQMEADDHLFSYRIDDAGTIARV